MVIDLLTFAMLWGSVIALVAAVPSLFVYLIVQDVLDRRAFRRFRQEVRANGMPWPDACEAVRTGNGRFVHEDQDTNRYPILWWLPDSVDDDEPTDDQLERHARPVDCPEGKTGLRRLGEQFEEERVVVVHLAPVPMDPSDRRLDNPWLLRGGCVLMVVLLVAPILLGVIQAVRHEQTLWPAAPVGALIGAFFSVGLWALGMLVLAAVGDIMARRRERERRRRLTSAALARR